MTSPDSFLHGLHEGDRAALAQRWSVRRYQRKEMIIAHDEETRDVFFVLEGSARATVYSEAGRAVAYRDIESGRDIRRACGDRRATALGDRDRARAGAGRQTAARRLSQMVRSHPDFTWVLLTHLALQTRRMTERIYEFSTLVMRKRLVRELLRLAEPDGSVAARASIRPAPTYSDLAARISTHREAVSREMSALAKLKLIEKRKGLLVLPDIGRLEALCHEEE